MQPMKHPNDALWNGLAFALALLLFLPTLLWLVEAWLSDPYYAHGPLVLVAALYLIWVRRKALADSPRAPSDSGALVLALALAVHLWALVWRAFYLSALVLPLAFLGLLAMLFGWRIARQFLFPLAFLFLMVPLPLAERFGPTLEGWAATSATALAQTLGVPAQNDGAQVFLPNSTFTVGIPCGGLHSVIAIITLATLFVYIVRGTVLARLLLFLAAIPIALAANTLRIALLFAIANAWSATAAMDYFHNLSSPVLFLATCALLLGAAHLLRCTQIRWEVILPE